MVSSTKKSEDKGSVESKIIPMYRIAWKSMLTNAHGYIQRIYPKKQAELIVKTLNKGSNLVHWAELIQPDVKGED